MLFKNTQELVELTHWALQNGLNTHVLGVEGSSGSSYSAMASPWTPGTEPRFRVVVTREVEGWKAYAAGDEMEVGRLLGYPPCCSEFYKKTWVDEKWRDPTWPMVQNGGTEGPVEANIMLRWLNVRLIRHLPCSLACEASAKIGADTLAHGAKAGLAEEMEWAKQLLSMNISWTSLHGIAEIVTPILRLSTNTDPFAQKAVVQKKGTFYPEEAAKGLDFPFEQPKFRKIADSKSFKTALTSYTFSDNGFSTLQAMEQSHDALLTALKSLAPPKNVLDLGCGNGLLLEKICRLFPGAVPHGVELDTTRAMRAYDLLQGLGGFVYPGSLYDLSLWDKSYDLNVFMPGRIAPAEIKDETKVKAIVEQLRKIPIHLMYDYGDRGDALFDCLGPGFTTVVERRIGNTRLALLVRADG
jgi:SAM-dependent methyltransferase